MDRWTDSTINRVRGVVLPWYIMVSSSTAFPRQTHLSQTHPPQTHPSSTGILRLSRYSTYLQELISQPAVCLIRSLYFDIFILADGPPFQMLNTNQLSANNLRALLTGLGYSPQVVEAAVAGASSAEQVRAF